MEAVNAEGTLGAGTWTIGTQVPERAVWLQQQRANQAGIDQTPSTGIIGNLQCLTAGNGATQAREKVGAKWARD
jgi:hypothetical protein